MSNVDIRYALGQMEKYGNIIIATPGRVAIPYITDPNKGENATDRALGPLVVVAETDESEFLKRADEFGLGDVRLTYSDPFFYLAVAE